LCPNLSDGLPLSHEIVLKENICFNFRIEYNICCAVVNVSRIKRHKDKRLQKRKDTKTQGCKVTKRQGCKDVRTQRHKVAKSQRHRDEWEEEGGEG
jgi:hypothetical protein